MKRHRGTHVLAIFCALTSVFLILNGCGGGGDNGGGSTPPPPAAFSQADVAGQWDVLFFSTGVTSGWGHGIVVIDNTGKWAPMTNFANSGGGAEPTPGSATWTVDSTGIISASDNGVANTFAGHMSSDKKLIVGVVGFNNGVSDRLTVLRKRTGTVFSNADLASKTLTGHFLDSGTDNTWGHAVGTLDGSGLITITSRVFPSGLEPPPYSSPGTISVSSTGIVTISGEPTYYGVMTDDKKVIFNIVTSDINAWEFGVTTITGQTYTQADLAGVGYFNTINSATTNPGWAWGSTSIDATGAGTYPTYKDSGNGANPGQITRILSATGVITDPASPTYHGQFSYNKNLSVRTGTNAIGKCQIAITIR